MQAKKIIGVYLAIVATAAFSAFAGAQTSAAKAPASIAAKVQPGNEPLQISLVRSKIVLDNGKELSKAADVARPGDLLEEVATYTNVSKATLKNLEPTLPVPPNTELVPGSIKPANARASLDGASFSALPLKRKIRQANGVETEQVVPPAEYRYLRWYPGDLPAGKSMNVSARFKVANDGNGAAGGQPK